MIEKSAHFEQVKQHNRKLIRNTLREKSPMRIAELVNRTGLSYPTVSALLNELISSQEVTVNPEAESCGGRPGQRYELNSAYQYALVMYFEDWELKQDVYDAYGKRVWSNSINVTGEICVEDLGVYVKEVKDRFCSLSTVVLGVPGAVCDGIIMHLPKFKMLEGSELKTYLQKIINIHHVLVENDINAIALAEVNRFQNFAHITYVNGCIGTGIVLNGELVRGAKGYAGELEYLCEDMNNQENTFATSILALACVLDLPDILISGEGCDEETRLSVHRILAGTLPEIRIPKIHLADNMEGRYKRGLLMLALFKWEKDE